MDSDLASTKRKNSLSPEGRPSQTKRQALQSEISQLTSSWSIKRHKQTQPPSEASHVNVTADSKTTPKALKACRNCRKSKIRCDSEEGKQCKHCSEQGLECIYEVKVPNAASNVADERWMTHVESRLDNFGSTLEAILSLLKEKGSPGKGAFTEETLQQTVKSGHQLDTGHAQLELQQNSSEFPECLSELLSPQGENRMASITNHETNMLLNDDNGYQFNQLLSDFGPTNFEAESKRIKSVTYDEAYELFTFFHDRISPHLFGFPISHFTLATVWTRSPILVAAICTVASAHHPNLISSFELLRAELECLSKEVMFQQVTSETETIDTIIALCVAGFWLPNSTMLTAIAVRLAQNLGISVPRDNQGISADKDKLRLWYLLYILDGHQSLTFNHLPSISYDDLSALKSRTLLLSNGPIENLISGPSGKIDDQKIWSMYQTNKEGDDGTKASMIADMRLVSQVEFNQAVKSVFEGRGWELLRPSTMGMPWQTNIDLDKWMVSWACLLTPTVGDMGSWPSKSTLIHYNFAKMHINSRAIRDIQCKGKLGETDDYMEKGGQITELSVSDNIAIAAAQNVLKLSTTDKDILSALQYVPVHIHMMLYYAALLLLHSLSSTKESSSSKSATLALVRRLRHAMLTSTSNRQVILGEITERLERAVYETASELKAQAQITEVDEAEEFRKEQEEHSRRYNSHASSASPNIAAWPGSVSSHDR